MAMKSRTSFQKRQKEIARMEKQRDKAARRMQRKLARKQGPGTDAEADGQDQITSDTSDTSETPQNP